MKKFDSVTFFPFVVGRLYRFTMEHEARIEHRRGTGRIAGPVKNFFGESVGMAGAESVEPMVVDERFAEPLGAEGDVLPLRTMNVFHLRHEHFIIAVHRIHPGEI